MPEIRIDHDRYEIIEKVAEGTGGVIYKALDRDLEQIVAIKTVSDIDGEKLYRLKREFRTLASIRHPNLINFYELHIDATPFITMEFVDGVDAKTYVAGAPGTESAGELLAARAEDLLIQILKGLSTLHKSGVIHRDIKPGNVLVEAGRVVLLDFGLSIDYASRAARVSMHGTLAGTIAYMAPEQLHGDYLTPAADLYGVGALMYECISGKLPRPNVLDVLGKGAEVPSLLGVVPELSAKLSDVIASLLSLDARHRPTIEQVFEALGVMPDQVTHDLNQVFVGRTEEIGRLQRAFEATKEHRPAAVAIEGSSGLGKSTLVETFLSRCEANTDGVLVFRSRCYPAESVSHQALDGLVDEVARFLTTLEAKERSTYLPGNFDALVRMFPVLDRVADVKGTHEESIHETRRRALSAITALLARIAERHHTIFWIDDLQWGHTDSVPFLRELLRSPGAPAALFIFSYRPMSDAAILEELSSTESGIWERVDKIALGPLADADARELFARLRGDDEHSLDPRLIETSAGSPFLISEFASARSDLVSGGLAELLDQRVVELDEETHRLLKLVSIADGPINQRVTLAASGLGGRGRASVQALESRHLIRTVRSGDALALDAYHDQIRHVLKEALLPPEKAKLHGDLLVHLQANDADDLQLTFHAFGAGEVEKGASYAIKAADHAADKFAFMSAAQLYAQALSWEGMPMERRCEVLRARGTALGQAGRGHDAATSFVDSAEQTNDAERIALLKALASEQYLGSGYFNEGEALLRPLFRDNGLRFPGSPMQSTLMMLPVLLRLLLRGVSVRLGRPHRASDRFKSELCWTAAKGWMAVDTLRAAYFMTEGLRNAEKTGNAIATSRFLAAFAMTILVPVGGWIEKQGRRFLDQATAIASEVNDPYLDGLLTIARGQVALQSGQWDEALTLCSAGERVLRSRPQAHSWETDIANMGSIRALEELGDFCDMNARSEALMAEAIDRGDRYAMGLARSYRSVARIALDLLDSARSDADALIDLWSTSSDAHLHHIYAVRTRIMINLAWGEIDVAYQELEEIWGRIESSGLLFAQMVRVDWYSLRARVYLMQGSPDLAAQARKDGQLLGKEERGDAKAWSKLISVAADARGESTTSAVGVGLLDAASMFERGGQNALAAICRYQATWFSKDDFRREGEYKLLKSYGVEAPDRWVKAIVPLTVPDARVADSASR